VNSGARGGTVNFDNCTLVRNQAGTTGGGLHVNASENTT